MAEQKKKPHIRIHYTPEMGGMGCGMCCFNTYENCPTKNDELICVSRTLMHYELVSGDLSNGDL